MAELKDMCYLELAARKLQLEKALKVLEEFNYDDVCRELGEINYLLAPDR